MDKVKQVTDEGFVYQIGLECAVDIDITVKSDSLLHAHFLADKVTELLQEQITVDCGELGSRVDDVYIEVGRIRKRDAFIGY